MTTLTKTNQNGSDVKMAKRLRLKSAMPKTSAQNKRTSDMSYDARADLRTIKKYEDEPETVDALDLRTWARYMLLALEWGDEELMNSPLSTFFELVDD